MDLAEFNALIERRIAAGNEAPPRQIQASTRFCAGDIVRYTPEFFRRINGYVADVAGEVASVNGRLIRVRWDDGSESSALDSNLEAPRQPEPVDMAAFAEHQRRQMLIAIDRNIMIGEAWR